MSINERCASVKQRPSSGFRSALLNGSVAFAILAVSSPPALALQSDDAAETARRADVIVVTARKREENLQETPITITAVTGAELSERNIKTTAELSQIVPNLSIGTGNNSSGGSSVAQIFLRGVGQNDFLITTDPGVGIYIDGVYYARSVGAVMDLLDLERVEVLRGPQGTLFGRNTIGGAISLVSARPTDEVSGHLELGTGSFDRFEAIGSINFPLSETLLSKLSVSYKRDTGFGEQVLTGENQGDENAFAARGTLEWSPSEKFRLTISGDVTREREGAIVNVIREVAPTAPLFGFYMGVAIPEIVPPPGGATTEFNDFVASLGGIPILENNDDTRRSFGTGSNENDLDLWGVSTTIEYDVVDWLTIKSITAYREMDALFGRDGDNTPFQYIDVLNSDTQEQFSQELQLIGENYGGRLQWVIGGFYFDEDATNDSQVRLASGLFNGLEALPAAVIPLAPVTCPPPMGVFAPCAGGAGNPINIGFDLDFNASNRVSTQSAAVFTHASFDMTERLRVSGGLRYTFEDRSYFTDQLRINANVPLIPPTGVSDDFSDVSVKAGVDVDLSENMLAFASFSQGFKSGGFNGRPTVQTEVDSFDPETINSYELGIKSELFDRRVRLNATGFYYDYKDIQLSIVDADTTGNLIAIIENAGEANAKGIEVEILARPIGGLDLGAFVGFIDAEFTDLDPGSTISLDTEFVLTPKWTAGANIAYSWPIAGIGEATLRGNWSYKDGHFTDVPNTPSLAQESYSLFGASASVSSLDGAWTATVYGRNLSDKEYITSGVAALDSFGEAEGVLGRPREWGLKVKYNF